ncbi:MAG: hypothetical protein JNJ57_19055 [Saprospiraceae bacterium]|nr:hypothetical protein [Saprospiraceae bacterium]
MFYRYPAIDDEVVSQVVGLSHFNLEKLKELVIPRPELARAVWDWGFGDWESALGAAAHVGRRDIALFLMEKGARADIFTFTMMGQLEVVKAMIKASPGIESVAGPHGFSLLHHAKVGLESNDLTEKEKRAQHKMVEFVERLGNADQQEKYMEYSELNKEIYLGDYKYGDGEEDGFTIRLNMRKMLSFGRLGKFGGSLYRLDGQRFRYNGAPSVEISFQLEGQKVVSLTVHEPSLILTAKKVTG